MLHKNASFILAIALGLALLVGVPTLNASASSQINDTHGRVVLNDEIPTPTPTPIGGGGSSTNSGGSGGGNTGG